MRRVGTDAAWGGGPVVVVSPHLDDAVFACGRLLARLARRREVIVATVFAGRPSQARVTAWDRAAGFADGADVIGMRRTEDRRALAVIGARPRWLPLLDSQYGTPPRVSAVARALARLPGFGRRRAAMLLFPLGLFHSDHVLVRDAMVSLLRRRPRCCLAYEDALYRRLPGLRDEAVARLRRTGLAPKRLFFAANADANRRKERAVGCYASQLHALATPGRLGHADTFAEERYWALRVLK